MKRRWRSGHANSAATVANIIKSDMAMTAELLKLTNSSYYSTSTTVSAPLQAVRILAIWSAGKAVGVDLSPRPYYVMGPLLFLVMLVPFTINGLAVRESFFVSFLGGLGVSADQAFSTGFLFFLVTLVTALPGAAIVAWEGVNRAEPKAAR